MADHETPARIELLPNGQPRKRPVRLTVEERLDRVEAKTSFLQVSCGLVFGVLVGLTVAERLLSKGDEGASRSHERAHPELPVSEPVRLDAPADASRNGDKFKDVVAASVNDHNVPPALLECSNDSHRGDRTPK